MKSIGFNKVFWTLVTFLFISGGIVFYLVQLHTDEVRQKILLESARTNAELISTVQNFYSKEVVGRVKNLAGLSVTHDFRAVDNAIPLPATLTIELSKEFKSSGAQSSFRLISEHPFPLRKDRELSDFDKRALVSLVKEDQKEFFGDSIEAEKRVFNYATPVIMSETCIACHNTRADSPKQDWKVGDVRGALVISQAGGATGTSVPESLKKISLFLALVFVLTTALLALLIRRYRRVHEEVKSLASSAVEQNEALEHANLAAEASNKRLVDAIEALPDGFVLYDKDDRLVVSNQKYKQIYAASADHIKPGNTFEDIIRKGAEAGQYNLQGKTLDAWVEERISAHRDKTGMVEQHLGNGQWLRIIERGTGDGGTVGFRVDITELKEREAKLKRSEEQLRTTVRSALDAIIVINDHGEVMEFNPAAEQIFGFKRNKVVGRMMSEFIIPNRYRDAHGTAITHFLNTGEGPLIGQRIEIEALHAKGHEFMIELAIQQAEGPDGTIFLGYARDVTEKKAAEAQILQERDRAEVANRAKASFLAMMSHEIRTPLNGVLGILGLLGDETDRTEQQRLIRTARVSGKALLTIINDILDFSKLEAGRLDLDEEVFLVDSLINGVESLVSHRARENTVDLRIKIGKNVPEAVTGDPGRIRQILLNLTWNAIKFSEGGKVEIAVSQRTRKAGVSTVRFSVKDTGIGIPTRHHDELFAEFSMLDASYSRKFGGTGLGLAISKSLVLNMGGEIDFKSTPGKGSTFWFDLPMTIADASDAVPFDELESDEDIPAVDQLRVLLAEDNTTNQLVIGNMLERLGCLVDIVSNGIEVIDSVQSRPYDVVLMDISMPEMDGLEATKHIRALDDEVSKIPIIALTAYALDEDRQTALTAGMDEFVAKPVSRLELARAISRQSESRKNGSAAPDRDPDDDASFDMSVFNTLVGGMSPETRKSALSAFAAELENWTSQVAEAADHKDIRSLEKSSHSIKGVAGTFGASALQAMAARVNTYARGDKPERALELAKELGKLCELTLNALNEMIARAN
ncbi:ATP-binding protein [Anderseniella sp. Alg231-50]|uniref:ATP-binding protein n=1 Tax=Anderseniella sp. Alg231-50 TaxID=1922226 RepID=UPI000D5521A7